MVYLQAEDLQFLAVLVEDLTAVFGGEDQILHPHTELTRQVDTRLTGKDHGGVHRIGVVPGDIAGIMQVDAM